MMSVWGNTPIAATEICDAFCLCGDCWSYRSLVTIKQLSSLLYESLSDEQRDKLPEWTQSWMIYAMYQNERI
ncbi:hypothetical protein N007_05530 [Alicyclobacillus acidoterrestris ATCC 49025]|nr:hypothetical protein N007_05530 [Alicyclobacillus acidoterrestris ATCC 49025]